MPFTSWSAAYNAAISRSRMRRAYTECGYDPIADKYIVDDHLRVHCKLIMWVDRLGRPHEAK